MCWRGENITSECLTQSPMYKTVQGMSTGLLAGIGAAFGAVWNIKQQD
jgi:hypothetical protein